jgi:DNA-binding transcriptional MocR family regulator
MPKKKSTTPGSTASTPGTPALPPAASAVLSLLDVHKATTAAELADRAGLGRSTVTKALATLHNTGLAARREGGHEGTRRIADQWFAAPATAAYAEEQADASAGGPAAGDGTVEESPTTISDTALDDSVEDVTVRALPEVNATHDETEKDEPSADRPKEAAETGTKSDGGPYTAEHAAPAQEQAELVVGGTSDAASLTPEETEETKSSEPRLGKGELRAQVEEHLSTHPDKSFTSTEIHHVLKRSSGAIANACDKLVAENKAIIASEKPRRFQWNSASETA